MSLGRLLAAGRSLVGAQDGAGRYRVNKHMALPKFISPHNPFVPEAKSEALSAQAESLVKDRGVKSVGVTAKADMHATVKNDLQISMGMRAARWLGEWRQKMNPLPRLPKRPGPVRSTVPRFTRPPVQPELSLDKVQVVRNDLSDADFEVVMKKTPFGSQLEQPALPRYEMGSAGNTWDRLTTRFFGVGQT